MRAQTQAPHVLRPTTAPMRRSMLGRLGRALALHELSVTCSAGARGGPVPPLRGVAHLRVQSLARPTASSATVEPAAGADTPSEAGGQYPFRDIEARWQRHWEEHSTFRTPDQVDTSKPKFYALDMFPYPSGAGLHVGHPEGYTATDIVARYKRMLGYNVLHPMGWDAFGLPAEQYAIDTGTHPSVTTRRNIDRFREQLKSLGFSYDWSREVATCDVSYYKWTQWIFLKLFERGLAYQAEVAVNWCPALGTVLANEEVVDGLSERGSHPVIRRPMRQWMLRITAYADRLLEDLDSLDWPESIKDMQRNWIGRSIGIELGFQVHEGVAAGKTIQVFTTRPDTLFGVTYVVVAPEHPLTLMLATSAQREAVASYLDAASRKSDLERTELSKNKTGVWTGAYARNPATGEDVPVWVSDYVLGGYGCGAVMAVPAHDERDFEFARAFNLPIRQVVTAGGSHAPAELPLTAAGTAVNSANATAGLDINGLTTDKATDAVAAWLEARGLGAKKVNYKLRDWLFARQRYWGEPFPIVFPDGSDEAVPLREEDLPIVLPPTDNFRPSGDGDGPLSNLHDWVRTVDSTGRQARRETNTMPQWAGSCWYYLRFINPTNETALVDRKLENYWMPVDLYVGGAEHAVLHLLYARFWHKVLYDIGVVSTKEPFHKLVSQGMILGEVEFTVHRNADGKIISADSNVRDSTVAKLTAQEVIKKGDGYVLKADPTVRVAARAHKMSKSRGNVVNPDDIVKEYGADSLRLYEMFMGPLRETKVWSTRSVDGVHRFLGRVWRLFDAHAMQPSEEQPSAEQMRTLHATIKRVSEDTDEMRFNTAISAMMEFVNAATKWQSCPRQILEPFTLLLAPYAPHIAEELWCRLGHTQSLAYAPWPTCEEKYLVQTEVSIAVQVNGKLRGTVTVPADAGEEAVYEAAMALKEVSKWFDGMTVKRKIYVPGRLLNVVVAPK